MYALRLRLSHATSDSSPLWGWVFTAQALVGGVTATLLVI